MDLSERREHEQLLRQSEQFLQAVTDNIPARVAYWDAKLRCRFANSAYRERFGKSAGEILGMPMLELVGPETFADTEPYFRRALQGETQQFERTLSKDGNAVCNWVHYMPDIYSSGDRQRVRGFYVPVSDITELKHAQLELQNLNAALSVRTREAESATIAKSQFLANMSHEIRSPMNAIMGMQQLLLDTELNVRQRDYAVKAHAATRSLLHLLNDILDFSKTEAGKVELELHPFTVDSLLRDMSVILSATLGNKPIEVLFDVDPQMPRLLGDVLRLRQVLLNLAGNAIKFTERGEVTISISVAARQYGRTAVEFSVRDTGIGIKTEKLAGIFEGFSQAEASTTRRYGGTGLGLAISQRLVGLMGGILCLSSEFGAGSRFFFTLELQNYDEPDAAGTLRARLLDPELRVLVVDDNAQARQVLLGMLQALGLQCATASGGHEALACLAAADTAYDVVLVDAKMPELDGLQTAVLMRAHCARRVAIVAMATMHSRESLAAQFNANSDAIDGFLVTPCTAWTSDKRTNFARSCAA
jgi:PAS domain S-box-containing protein